MGSKNANVNDINGCKTVRTGMTEVVGPRNRNRPCRNGKLPRKKAPQPRPPPLINGTPPVVDLFLWTSNGPPYAPPQSEKSFSGGPENAPFPVCRKPIIRQNALIKENAKESNFLCSQLFLKKAVCTPCFRIAITRVMESRLRI